VSKPKHQTRIILFTVGFLSAVFLLFLVSFSFQSESSINPDDVKSIAVLPLKPLTSENREPKYEFGIADSLILKLSSAKGLVVRSLSATRQYAAIEQDAIAAGREQQVDYVLASNYQIADGKIRITSQLINVQSGLVEEVFKDEQNNSNIFAVQDAVAANIGQLLLKRLNREPNNILAKRYTTNEEAYGLYLQGIVRFRNTNGQIVSLNCSLITTVFPNTNGCNPIALSVFADAAVRYRANSFEVGDSIANARMNTAGFRFNADNKIKKNSHVLRLDFNLKAKQALSRPRLQ